MSTDHKKYLRTSLRKSEGSKSSNLFKLRTIKTRYSEEVSNPSDFYSTFLYRDQVTRFKYQMSGLKNSPKAKTLPNQESSIKSQTQLQFYLDELNLLKTIKQNRNKQLVSLKSKPQNRYINQISFTQNNASRQIEEVKRQIRRQVLGINQQFLREYLYHQQPFNKVLVEINNESNSGIIDHAHIENLRKKLIKCIEDRAKQGEKNVHNLEDQKIKKLSNKANKKMIQNNIDEKFQMIWGTLRKQIGVKVKMEGQFNLYKNGFAKNL